MNGNQHDPPPLSFWQDKRDCWRRLPNKGFFFFLLAAWLALFQFLGNSILGYIHTPSLFSWMHEAYRSSGGAANDDAQGNFIPFLVVGLFWWKRKELLASSFNLWWPGLLILTAAMALHVLGFDIQQPDLSIVALFTGIYGLMGLAWGPEWLRKSVFPFFLFIFSVPLGAQSEFITFPLRQLVSWLVEVVAHWILGIDVIRVGTQLYNASGTYQYEVAAACSGMPEPHRNFSTGHDLRFPLLSLDVETAVPHDTGVSVRRFGKSGADAVHHHGGGTRRAASRQLHS